MAKATPKKVMTPKAASNDKSPKILGAQKQKTPKSAGKALKPSTPQVMPMAAAIKKRKSVATSFQVSDIAEEKTPKKTSASTPAKTPLTGKKQKKSVQPQTPEVESVQTKKKKKQSLVVEDAVEETPTKTKKKSLAAQSETPTSTPNEKKKKKLSVATATASMPFKVEKKMKPATAAPEAESSTGETTKKRKKRNRGKKSKSDGVVEGATPSKKAKVESDDGASPSKKAKLDPENIQQKTGKGNTPKPERTVYTLYVGNLSYNMTPDLVRDHFTKAGVVPGRIHFPLTKDTNLPRGFAYVDLPDNDQYLKGLKLHNTFIGKRHIRVEFTMPGKKKAPNRMKAIKSKDLKLKAMQRRGILLPKVKPTLSEIIAKSEAE